MASWFYAAEGKQQGPFPDGQFRDLVAQGVVRPDTLVWTEGMAGWQKAAEIPGLIGGAPPAVPMGAPALSQSGYSGGYAQGGYQAGYAGGGGALSIDFGIVEFIWRSIAFLVGAILIIPLPWVFVWYTKWIVSCIQVPGRPNLSFTGSAMALVPWYFGAIVLAIALAFTGIEWLNDLMFVVQIVLYWLLIKWMVANIASNDQPLGLSFSGTIWAYIGWNLLLGISFLTIIGWAWVYVAQIRWFCRNIQGTRRAVVFKGSGLEMLWRSIVAFIGFSLIIPIPWACRWMMRWMASQTELVAPSSQS
jgi:hypothetical protein